MLRRQRARRRVSERGSGAYGDHLQHRRQAGLELRHRLAEPGDLRPLAGDAQASRGTLLRRLPLAWRNRALADRSLPISVRPELDLRSPQTRGCASRCEGQNLSTTI